MSDERFPLPGSSYKELSKIIAAYATITGATAPGPVAQVAVVHETVVSRNNKFLVAAGLIEGGQKKTCTSLGGSLGRAIQHEQDEAIGECWGTVVSQTDFLQKIISAVRIRKGMEESALVSHIAFTSGNTKSAYARAGAGAIIEILQLSKSIAADGSTLVALTAQESLASAENSTELMWSPMPAVRGPRSNQPGAPFQGPERLSEEQNAVQLTIALNIKCDANDLDGLGLKLRNLVNDFEGKGNKASSIEVNLLKPNSSGETEEESSSSAVTEQSENTHETDR